MSNIYNILSLVSNPYDFIICDLYKWNKHNNILYIAGIPASGKTTIAKQLQKTYECDIFSTDQIIDKIANQYSWDVNTNEMPISFDEYYNIYKQAILNISKKQRLCIVEGISVQEFYTHEKNAKQIINNSACILVDTKFLKALYSSFIRTAQTDSEKNKWINYMKWSLTYKSFVRQYNEFKYSRLSMKDSVLTFTNATVYYPLNNEDIKTGVIHYKIGKYKLKLLHTDYNVLTTFLQNNNMKQQFKYYIKIPIFNFKIQDNITSNNFGEITVKLPYTINISDYKIHKF